MCWVLVPTFIQTAAANPGAPGSSMTMPGMSPSKPIHFHYHANVSGISNDGIREMLNAHGDRMFQFFRAGDSQNGREFVALRCEKVV